MMHRSPSRHDSSNILARPTQLKQATISATSDGTQPGVDNRKGGLCLNKHMKIKFEVQPGKLDMQKSIRTGGSKRETAV